jgi:hypothetical protein
MQPQQQEYDPFTDNYAAGPGVVYQDPYSVTGPLSQQGAYQNVPGYQYEQQESNEIENYLLNLEKQPAYYDFSQPADFSPRNYQKEWKASKEKVDDDGASSRSGASFRSKETAEDPSKPKLHFGPAPPVQARRNAFNAKKRVALTHGNLVLDCKWHEMPANGRLILNRSNSITAQHFPTAQRCRRVSLHEMLVHFLH